MRLSASSRPARSATDRCIYNAINYVQRAGIQADRRALSSAALSDGEVRCLQPNLPQKFSPITVNHGPADCLHKQAPGSSQTQLRARYASEHGLKCAHLCLPAGLTMEVAVASKRLQET
ncbi:uncharacterized protein LOC144128115 isoform X2 [Amblyomma americanum]